MFVLTQLAESLLLPYTQMKKLSSMDLNIFPPLRLKELSIRFTPHSPPVLLLLLPLSCSFSPGSILKDQAKTGEPLLLSLLITALMQIREFCYYAFPFGYSSLSYLALLTFSHFLLPLPHTTRYQISVLLEGIVGCYSCCYPI